MVDSVLPLQRFGFEPWWGIKIPHATWYGQNKQPGGYFESTHLFPQARREMREKPQLNSDFSRLNEPRSLAPKLPKTTWDQDESRTGRRLQGRETDRFHKASLHGCQQLLRVINHLRQHGGEKPGLRQGHVVFKRAKTECSQLVS